MSVATTIRRSICLTLSSGLKAVLMASSSRFSLQVPPGARMGPMEAILTEIDRALDAGLYYLAIALSLTLPDICGALESPDGGATRERFTAWYDTYLAQTYQSLTAADCYSLRCGVIHQGRFG